MVVGVPPNHRALWWSVRVYYAHRTVAGHYIWKPSKEPTQVFLEYIGPAGYGHNHSDPEPTATAIQAAMEQARTWKLPFRVGAKNNVRLDPLEVLTLGMEDEE